MTLAALLRRTLGSAGSPSSERDPPPAPRPAVPRPEPAMAAAPAPPPSPRRRLTPSGWRRVLVDTAVLHWVRWDSRAARYEVLAAAAGLPVVDFMDEVKRRYAAVLRRDARGRRPMEVDAFAARLRALAAADPNAAARLADVRLMGDEAERRAEAVRCHDRAAEKVATARGLAAVLAAAALVGRTVEAPADTAPPPVV